MPHESPFHTDSPEYPPTHRNVYHDNSLCDHGKAIKQEHRVSGPGGRPRCDRCDALASKEHGRPVLRRNPRQPESHVTDVPAGHTPVCAMEPQRQPPRCSLAALPTAPARQPTPGAHQRHRPPHRRSAHVPRRLPGEQRGTDDPGPVARAQALVAQPPRRCSRTLAPSRRRSHWTGTSPSGRSRRSYRRGASRPTHLARPARKRP